jgi:hypothetical protein
MGLKKIWIGELLYRVDTAMRNDFALCDSVMELYRSAFKVIERYFIRQNEGYYSPQAGEKLVEEKVGEYRSGIIKHEKFHQIRRICMFLEQYYTNGKLTYFRLPRFGCK